MSLEENIKKILNKVKHFDMKLGQFEKKLEELEQRESLVVPGEVDNELLTKIAKYLGFIKAVEETELEEEVVEEVVEEPAQEELAQEELISDEVLQEIDEVINDA